MKHKGKQLMAIVMTVLLAVGLMSACVFAEELPSTEQAEETVITDESLQPEEELQETTEEEQVLLQDDTAQETTNEKTEVPDQEPPLEGPDMILPEEPESEAAETEQIPVSAAEEQGTEAETEEEAAAEEPETDITQEEQTQPAAEEQEERTGPEEETETVAPEEETTEVEAAASNIIRNGSCGENMTWTLDADGVLTISGSGDMTSIPFVNAVDTSGPGNNSDPDALKEEKKDVKEVVINEGIRSVVNKAFSSCGNLQKVTFPDTLETIGVQAFSGCASLEDIVWGAGLKVMMSEAFVRCSGLTEVTIPDSVTNIGTGAFGECTGLLKVTFGKKTQTIGDFAFSSCSSLSEIVIPSGVTTIGEEAFIKCTSLGSVTIPASVNVIGKRAFGYWEYYDEREGLFYRKVEGFEIFGESEAARLYAALNQFLFNGELITDQDDITEMVDNFIFSEIAREKLAKGYAYTGEEIKPEIEVVDTEKALALALGTDYTVTYKNNVKVGRATITVQGIGDYADAETQTTEFQICFTDVPLSHNYQKAVYWSLENGIAKGFSDGHFGVGESITRGQFILMLWRIAGKPEPSGQKKTFKDVPVTSSMFKAVQWAAENKITSGYTKGTKKGYFGINDPITRGQLMMFLWRYMGRPAVSGTPKEFSDVPPAHSYYQAIQWASAANITSGKNGAFLVGDSCTRGQCAKFLYQLFR